MPELTFIDQTWDVNASPGDVFELMQDVDGWPDWGSKVRSTSRESNGELREGDTFEFVPDLLVPLPLEVKVMKLDPPSRFSWGVRMPGFEIEHGFEISEQDGGCEVRQYEYAQGFLAYAGLPLKPSIKGFDQSLGDDLQRYFQ